MKKCLLVLTLLAVLPLLASAQSTTPASVGATPLSANFDPWPNFLPADNTGWNFDIGPIGRVGDAERFILFGLSNDGSCGPKKIVVSKNGTESALMDGIVDDNGQEFVGAASAATYGETDGFGYRCDLDADPNSGNYIVSYNFFNNDYNGSLGYNFNKPVSFFTYSANSLTDPTISTHYCAQRFARDGSKVSNLTAGRNIPSAVSHTQEPYWTLEGHSSRTAGVAVLSNGNNMFYQDDAGTVNNVGPADYWREVGGVPSLIATRHNINVHTVTNPAATSFIVNTTPTFLTPAGDSLDLGDSMNADAGNGWFAMKAGSHFSGSLAVFKNDGKRIEQIFGYATIYQDTPGLLPGENDTLQLDGRNYIACSDNMIYVITRLRRDGADPLVPCVLRFQVNEALTDVTPLPAILPDSDLKGNDVIGSSISERAFHVAARSDGVFAVSYRKNPADAVGGGSVVCRVYKADGTPATGSFFVSSLADPTSDNCFNYGGGDRPDSKLAINNEQVVVAWHTENGINDVEETDCSGGPKSASGAGLNMDTAVRVFRVDGITEVGNWDLY